MSSIVKDEETLELIMNRILEAKNCTQKDDITRQMMREMQGTFPISDLMRMLHHIIPSFQYNVEKYISTSRADGKKVYEDRTIILISVFLGVFGVQPISGIQLFNTEEGIKNFSLLCQQQGLKELPNYQTVTNALDAIEDLGGFNSLYQEVLKGMIQSKRYDTGRVALVVQGKRETAKEEFPISVNKYIPAIADGVETLRTTKRQSEYDLVYVFKDKEGNVTKTEYAHKFEVMIADLGQGIMAPLCALPIENDPEVDYADRTGEGDTEKRKQSCETRVGFDMLESVREAFPGMPFLFQGDGLYLTSTFIDFLLSKGFPYLTTFKEGCAPALFKVAMSEMEKTPAKIIKSNGTEMEVKYVMDVGGLSGDPKWELYPINVLMAKFDEELLVCDEHKEKKVWGRKGIKAEFMKNQENPLPDFSKTECDAMFKRYLKKSCPKMSNEDIEETLKNVVYVQTRDTRSLCRRVTAKVTRRFIWATNVVLNLDENETAKALLKKELFKGSEVLTNPAKRAEANRKLSGFLGDFIYRARQRWKIENLFNVLKNGDMKIEKRKCKRYKVEKAFFYISLLSWFILELHRAYSEFAAKALKNLKVISSFLLSSCRYHDAEKEKDYIEKKTCMRIQFE